MVSCSMSGLCVFNFMNYKNLFRVLPKQVTSEMAPLIIEKYQLKNIGDLKEKMHLIRKDIQTMLMEEATSFVKNKIIKEIDIILTPKQLNSKDLIFTKNYVRLKYATVIKGKVKCRLDTKSWENILIIKIINKNKEVLGYLPLFKKDFKVKIYQNKVNNILPLLESEDSIKKIIDNCA